jgi:hypothetical protein
VTGFERAEVVNELLMTMNTSLKSRQRKLSSDTYLRKEHLQMGKERIGGRQKEKLDCRKCSAEKGKEPQHTEKEK